jgi:hypothetical protein
MNNDMNLENFDEISFRPITDGLGFHNDLLDKEAEVKKIKSVELDPKENHAFSKYFTNEETLVDRGDLTPFYNNGAEVILQEETPFSQDEAIVAVKDNSEVTLVTRFLAWTVDVAIIVSFYFITFFTSLSFVGASMDKLMNLTFFVDTLPVLLFYYIFYFSFLDKTNFSTVGKRVFNIQIKQNRLTMLKTLSRTLITLTSLLTLGLGCVLKLQDKLTDTEVTNK